MTSRTLCCALALLWSLLPSSLLAAPLHQQATPSIQVSPDTVRPGQTVRVSVSGITVRDPAGLQLCLGVLGPGQNLEQGIFPAFRSRLGRITVGTDGTGETEVQILGRLVPGDYRVAVGGCPPQPDLAPLAALAVTNITVTPPGLQTTYYFAEGATVAPFDTWLLLFNPNSSPATATVTILGAGLTSTHTVTVAPNARTSLYLNQIFPNTTFGMRVDSNLPIAAERAMFFRQDGTTVPGIPAPSSLWLFGEGATAFPHQTWFLMMNPNNTAATAILTFYLEDGTTQTTQVEVPPLSRSTVYANLILPPTAFATRITSSLPIVAERSMFKEDTGSGSSTAGAPNPSPAWYFAEGSTASPFDSWFLLFNPHPNPVRVLMRLYPETAGPGPLLDFTIPANSRHSLYANAVRAGMGFGATIVTEGGGIVAERSMFFGNGSTGSQGAAALATAWHFAEGATAPPFQEWLLLANPSGAASANATVTFFLPDGTQTSQSVVVPGEGRVSLYLNQLVPNTAVATRVTSDLPIVAERSMYFGGGNGGTNAVGIPQ